MPAEFLAPTDRRWTQFLETCPHDVYHLPEYLTFCAEQEGGEAVAFLVEDGPRAFLLPMLLRELPLTLDPSGRWRDASAPYGYACPLLAGDPGPEQVAAFLGQFREIAQLKGIVSAFFRFHPLLPLPREPFLDFGTLVDHGETVYLDLTLSREELEDQVRAGHRADIRRLQEAGYRVSLDQWERLDDFVRLYNQTMLRHAASPFYFFSPEYYISLRRSLGDRLHLALVHAPDTDQIASAALFMEEEGFLEYHLSGTDEAYLKAAPAKLLLQGVRDWGKARGNRWFHLGGGVGAQADSLFDFKKGFSKLRSGFTSFRMIVNQDAYGELSSWNRRGSDRKLLERRRYFPGYRRPADREFR